MMSAEQRLKDMGVTLPEKAARGGVYQPVMQSGNYLYISGQGCTRNGVAVYNGKVGEAVGMDEAKDAARICAINALGALKEYLGTLEDIRLVKTLAFVSSAPTFSDQHLVANGCSEFLKEVFGAERGVGARSAIGVAQLPGDIPVEIEFMFEIIG